jgi:TRAP-type mannitol/chloroaromatic compound transport system substrate-binding protein
MRPTTFRSSPPRQHTILSLAMVTTLLAGGLLAGCGGEPGDAPDAPSGDGLTFEDGTAVLTYHQFSTSPSLAWGQGSSDPLDPDYGALSFFVAAVPERTGTLDGDRRVVLELADGPATAAQVAAGEVAAAHVSGGSLNPAWGFLVNSIPFGPDFGEMAAFLYDGGGLELVNDAFRGQGMDVVALPVVGSPEQIAGYFPKPLGIPDCPEGDEACRAQGDGIGIAGLCAESWTLRYLPPAETILDQACDRVGGERRMDFVQAIPGGSAFLTAVQQGTIDGFEFATPLDDWDAARGGFFANPSAPAGSDGRNLGEIGLRYVHHPGWHQPFFMGWMVVSRSRVWDALDPEQQDAVRAAGREALLSSHQATDSVQCHYFRQIMEATPGTLQRGPDGETRDESAELVLTRWTDDDLALLKSVAVEVMEAGRGGDSPSSDQADYGRILDALLAHLGHDSVQEMADHWFGADGSSPLAACLGR